MLGKCIWIRIVPKFFLGRFFCIRFFVPTQCVTAIKPSRDEYEGQWPVLYRQ